MQCHPEVRLEAGVPHTFVILVEAAGHGRELGFVEGDLGRRLAPEEFGCIWLQFKGRDVRGGTQDAAEACGLTF